MEDRITLFAEILLPLPLPKVYTYRLPFEWNELLVVGMRVAVPFGVKKVYSGIVWKITERPPEGYQANYIIEILDDRPIVTSVQMEFWEWVSRYYLANLGDVLNVALPAGYRVQSQTKISLHPEINLDDLGILDEKENLVLSLLIKEKIITVEQVQQILNQKTVMKVIKSMYHKGLISMQEELRENYKPKWLDWIQLTNDWSDENFANETLNHVEKRANKQFEALMHLLGRARVPHPLKQFCSDTGVTRTILNALYSKGWIKLFQEKTDHLKLKEAGKSHLELTQPQKEVAVKVGESFEQGIPVLIQGVTGSGKTYIYLNSAIVALEEGKQVLFLVPEVALTENLVERISEYIPQEIGVWHHYYSSYERTELYDKISKREVNFIIGTRSALFAPFCELGLIIIDEEHEPSYKQFEKRPLFHARDAAFYLARQWGAHLLMGSATPSYEMLHLAAIDKIKLLRLDSRFDDRKATQWIWLDSKELKQQNRQKELFSDPMLDEMKLAWEKGKKTIVYHNRKGYAPFMQCALCGHTTQCIQCDIALTYYKSSLNQRCNYCGHSQSVPKVCPGCGGNHFQMKGTGTEKIVEALEIYFPKARISRFDQQSIKKRSDFQRIIHDFNTGQIDFLVGTQLLSKGIDFESVELICVPDADLSLNIPDFRSHERAFQQLYQLAGRAGRGDFPGKILVQTYKKNHPVYLALNEQNFDGFSQSELEAREAFFYPPFGRLIEISIKHKNEATCMTAAMIMNNLLRQHLGDFLLGPVVPSVARVKNRYIQQFLLKLTDKSPSPSKIKSYLIAQRDQLIQAEGMNAIQVDFNVDPY